MPPKVQERLVIADIISGINSKVKETHSEIDFDDGPALATNRGNKLKRKAFTVHEGRLGGQGPYKKRINHAGFNRQIIHRKPLRYDDDGIPLDSDEEDEEADADAAERDPYDGVDVQALLMPLTDASDLWQHPGMSHALTNDALTNMVSDVREMLRKERHMLSLVKDLATRFRGDHIRAPSHMILAETDADLFSADAILRGLPEIDDLTVTGSKTPEPAIEVNVVAADEANTNGAREEGTQAEDVSMVEGDAEPPATANGVAEALTSTSGGPATDELGRHAKNEPQSEAGTQPSAETGHGNEPAEDAHQNDGNDATLNGTSSSGQELGEDETQDQPAPRMVTRGAAAAANGTTNHEQDPDKARSPSPPTSLPAIHPTFIPPMATIPDRDLGLPPWEAEETRKLLNVFVQKQEEVVRGMEKLYQLFLKAEKMRKTVYRWSRAEAHKGEMSDGEEWVDLDEWNLDTPLRKGTAEGEEESREEERKGKGRRTRAVG